jgi:hypothetical protein
LRTSDRLTPSGRSAAEILRTPPRSAHSASSTSALETWVAAVPGMANVMPVKKEGVLPCKYTLVMVGLLVGLVKFDVMVSNRE